MLTQCPFKEVTGNVWSVLDAAELAAKGSWFEPGGWGDQPQTLVEAVRLIWRLKRVAKMELKHRG